MNQTLLVVGSLCLASLSSGASAQSCPPGEYGQYKDKAHGVGLMTLAYDYCGARRTAGTLSPGAKKDACMSNAEKIGSALTAANAHKTFAWALDGCKGEFPTDEMYPKKKAR